MDWVSKEQEVFLTKEERIALLKEYQDDKNKEKQGIGKN